MNFISTCVNYNVHSMKAIPIQFITLITVEKKSLMIYKQIHHNQSK